VRGILIEKDEPEYSLWFLVSSGLSVQMQPRRYGGHGGYTEDSSLCILVPSVPLWLKKTEIEKEGHSTVKKKLPHT
jgi:hypothetical protein